MSEITEEDILRQVIRIGDLFEQNGKEIQKLVGQYNRDNLTAHQLLEKVNEKLDDTHDDIEETIGAWKQ